MPHVFVGTCLEQTIFKSYLNKSEKHTCTDRVGQKSKNVSFLFTSDIMMEFYLWIGKRGRLDSKWAGLSNFNDVIVNYLTLAVVMPTLKNQRTSVLRWII